MSEYLRFANEEVLMKAIAKNARMLGYLVFHIDVPQHSDPGFPDLHITGYGIVRYVETKGPRGRISDRQQQYIDTLRAAGETVYVAWSTNNEDFEIVMKDLEEAYERHFHATAARG